MATWEDQTVPGGSNDAGRGDRRQQTWPAPADGRPLKVLVVDDHDGVLEILEEIFEEWGCLVTIARSGGAAVDVVGAEPQDLVFMDVVMPGMNGVEAMRAIRGVAPRVPVVLMTANPHTGLVDDLTVPILLKPLDFDRLLGFVRAAARGAPVLP
jgi:CheY-like chemotaxis protein